MPLESLEENRCPFCDKLDCEDHILAGIDQTGEGEHIVGLVDGPLYDVPEIGTIYQKLCLSWVKWKRTKPKAPVPSWIANDPTMLDFFDSLKGLINLKNYANDEDAAYDLLGSVDRYFLETLLEDLCSRCGWSRFDQTVDGPNVPLLTTSFRYLYDTKPKEVAEKVRALLQDLIMQAEAVH